MDFKSFLVFIRLSSGAFVYALSPNPKTVSGCGQATAGISGDRIVGGRNAVEGEYPWQVASITVHQDFDPETFNNDIAILEIQGLIDIKSSGGLINGICLPKNKNVSGFATTSGWGATKESGGMSDNLQSVDLPVVPAIICSALYGEEYYTDSMLCAGEPNGGIDSCQGDSGGPLIQKTHTGRAVLVGIVSWGAGCARPGLPGVYTLVPAFIDWINTHVTEV